MKNICIIVSQVDRVIAFEWTVEGLDKEFAFSFILLGKIKNSYLSRYLQQRGIPVYEIDYSGKRDAFKAVRKIFGYLKKNKIDVVHTHLVEATLYGLFAAWLLRIKRRIYTRHHSDYNYKYSPKGIKYDKLSNWWATDVVAITEQVKNILIKQEKVSPEKISLIHHGIDTDYFENAENSKIADLQTKYNPGKKRPVVGVIARQTHWKGIQYVIPAFAEVLKRYPDALLILANAHGDYEHEIDKLIARYLPAGSFLKVKYEYDIGSLYRLLDVFVHVPVDDTVEAFGQVYVEALSAGVPGVVTLSGIALDFIENNKNAVVVPYCDSGSITEGLFKILEDDEFRQSLIRNARQSVAEKFALPGFLDKLRNLYNK